MNHARTGNARCGHGWHIADMTAPTSETTDRALAGRMEEARTMTHSVDRRTFLALLAMAGSAAAAPRLKGFGGKKVAVLGAGLAGLSAAWNLQKNGYDVVVVEAQAIPGGRVKTIRKPFTNGGYAEAGAVRIFNNHHWTQKYIKLMGLESKLGAYDDDQGAHLWYLQGKRFVTPAGNWPLDGLTSRERRDPFSMIDEKRFTMFPRCRSEYE
jgi:hypothetical protein